MRSHFTLALALAFLLHGSASAGAQEATTAPAPSGVEVTFLANAGFFLRAGADGVLVDSFVREPHGVYAALPFEYHQNIVLARPPYDVPCTVLVSHTHADHVQFRGLEKFLANSASSLLLAPDPIVAALKVEARDYPAIQARVKPLSVTRGQPQVAANGSTTVTVFELPHAGKENGDVRNFAYLIELGGLRLLHLGDAQPRPENFADCDFASKALDVVFVPYWYFGTDEGLRIVSDDLPARWRVAYHVPPREMDEFSAFLAKEHPDVLLFKNALEKRSFEPAPAPPGTSSGGGGR